MKLSHKKIYLGFYISFWILFTLGQVQRIQLTPAIAFYGHELALAVWFVWSVFH